MAAVIFKQLRPRCSELWMLNTMMDDANPECARDQLHASYAHGGGWHRFDGFIMDDKRRLTYPGDPPQVPMAEAKLRDETIILYPHGWVAIVQPNGSYEVARMD